MGTELKLPRRLDAAAGGQVVAQGFEKGPLIGTGVGQFDEGLEDLVEQGVALEAAGVEVVVDLDLVSGAPKVHQLVHLVDEGHRPSARCFKTEVSSPASVPGFELDFGAAPDVGFLGRVVLFKLVAGPSLARLGQQIVLIHQGRVREVARQSVENAAADGRLRHTEVMTMEEVVGGHVVESGHGLLPAVLRQHAADDEIDHHPPHLAQELRDGHALVRDRWPS